MKRRGFTLIELLVVIAIVAILTAILFPTFTRARERSKQISCASNLRELARAMRLYLDDNDDRYPEAWNTGYCEPWVSNPGVAAPEGKQPHEAAIRVVLEPYVSSPDLWRCPSDYGDYFSVGTGGYQKRTPPLYSWLGASYQWADIHYRLQGKRYLAGKRERQIKDPSTRYMIWDARDWHWVSEARTHIVKRRSFNNVAFCDGHVEAVNSYRWLGYIGQYNPPDP